MKCKCVICGTIIDVKGIDTQNQKCNVCKEKRLLNSLYEKKQLEQDKISFAVKQLEKVKEKLLEELKKENSMSKYKLDKSAQVVENTNYTMTLKGACEKCMRGK